MAFRVEPLAGHDRSAFTSGQQDLDDWFHERAGQDQRRNIARVFLLIDDQLGVVGFYSLNSFTVAFDELPPNMRRRLPRYPTIPATLIGRLARDERLRGQGVGELLLVDAMKRVLESNRMVAAYAIVVEAKDETTANFYRRFGFEPTPGQSLRLVLPLAAMAQADETT